MKVYELANELEVNSLDLVMEIRKLGYHIRNHMVDLKEEVVIKVRDIYRDFNLRTRKKTELRKTVIKRKTNENTLKMISGDNSSRESLSAKLSSNDWENIKKRCLVSEAQKRFKFNEEIIHFWNLKRIN